LLPEIKKDCGISLIGMLYGFAVLQNVNSTKKTMCALIILKRGAISWFRYSNNFVLDNLGQANI
jgi:hypothetical protein